MPYEKIQLILMPTTKKI